MTLRKVISLAHTPEKGRSDKSVKSVAQLRTAARIESRVSAWAGSNARISESVDVWSAKEGGRTAKRRPGKKR
jgi:hypothetical protein